MKVRIELTIEVDSTKVTKAAELEIDDGQPFEGILDALILMLKRIPEPNQS